MRIAQIAPLHEAVPPKFYGGTERVVSYLTDALVDLGHDVTLFASGDSQTKATLEAAWPRAARIGQSRPAVAPPINFAAWRRVILVFVIPTEVEESHTLILL